jgi:hypothetical protein
VEVFLLMEVELGEAGLLAGVVGGARPRGSSCAAS